MEESGLTCGVEGELSGGLVEGGGDGEDDGLVLEVAGGAVVVTEVSEGVVPGVAEVGEVVCGGGDGREHLGAELGAPGEDGAGAVDAGVREPGLGGADEAFGDAGALLAGEETDGVGGVGAPGEGEGAGGQLVVAGEVVEGGEEGARGGLSGRDELDDGEGLEARRGGLPVEVGEGAVGGAEVDADDEASEGVVAVSHGGGGWGAWGGQAQDCRGAGSARGRRGAAACVRGRRARCSPVCPTVRLLVFGEDAVLDMSLEEVIAHFADFVEGEFGSGVWVEHGGLVDELA